MKNLFISILLITVIGCKAQTVNIEDQTGNQSSGTYYADANNLLDTFEGIYVYQDGNKFLKIQLRKVTMSSRNNVFHEDLLIGEYQYIENGVEKANTLGNFTTNFSDQTNHSIWGNYILTGNMRGCLDCGANEVRLAMSLSESSTHNSATAIFRRVTSGGDLALKIKFNWQHRSYNEEIGSPSPEPSFPGGEYVLIKQ